MNDAKPAAGRLHFFALVRRSECWHPTFLGWLVLVLLFVCCGVKLLLGLYPFLAPNLPMPEGPVIVEGWGGTRLMKAALAEYQKHPTPPLLVSGGPIEDDTPLSEQFPSFAELGAWQLRRLGAPASMIQAVSAPLVQKDRTFASADTVLNWFKEHGGVPAQITLISSGPHSRRSWMLYKKAFGAQTKVGIVAVSEPAYDPARWWKYSAGFREVTDETIAFLYARLLFLGLHE